MKKLLKLLFLLYKINVVYCEYNMKRGFKMVERIVRAVEQGFDIDTIWYHVSNSDFDEFDLEKTQDGCIWLTRDLESIKNGETGASIKGDDVFIHEFYIRTTKLGGWNENDLYMDDQLIQDGYDGLILDDDIKLYHPENIRKTTDEFKTEKPNISNEIEKEKPKRQKRKLK